MTKIYLTTTIKAPIQTVFDLARNIDIHQLSTYKSKEKAIADTTKGLINLHESVTWRGKHFGFFLTHKSRIIQMEIPFRFIDKMERGHFKYFQHEHLFIEENGSTKMIDELNYKTPYGIFGKLFDKFYLKKYLTQFILERNQFLKDFSENQQHQPPNNGNTFCKK